MSRLRRPAVRDSDRYFFVTSNVLRTRAIAWAKIKTDRVDALVLAQLLRVG